MRPGWKPPSSATDPAEAPGRPRRRGRGRVGVLAHVQLRLGVVEAGHRMRDVVTVGQRQHVHARVRPELAAYALGDARHAGHRHRHHAVAARHVGLPADPGHRVAVAHQELITEIFLGNRVVRARGAVEHAERDLAPAVRHVEEQPAAPAVERSQEIEVGGVLHEPARVAGRQAQVRDRLVRLGRRIRREAQHALDLLVGAPGPVHPLAHTLEYRAVQHRLAPGDLQPDDSHRVSLRSRSRGTA